MWPRIIEIILAVWLFFSPSFLPDHLFILSDRMSSIAIALFSLFSFCPLFKRAHLLSLGVVCWLLKAGFSTFPDVALPSQENDVVIALLLLMLAIIPSHCNEPPSSWKKLRSCTKA